MLSGQCDVAVRVASKEVHSTTKVEEWHSRCQLASCQCECHWGAEGSAPKKRVWRLLPVSYQYGEVERIETGTSGYPGGQV